MKDNDNNKLQQNEDYRRVLATANKLETIHSNLETVIDFFLAPIVKLQTKLCNDCLKLLFESDFKLDQFRKTEELVWRRIYHDLYRFQKTKRTNVGPQDECLIESHFISGIGFYSSLIVKLRLHYKLDEPFGLMQPLGLALGPFEDIVLTTGATSNNVTDDDLSMSMSGSEDASGGTSSRLCRQAEAREWASQAIYRSLVYSGDLARYLLEVSQIDYRKLAYQFYISATLNQPDHGLPYNQLATLAGGINFNLDAVCNYMRCCLRPKPFEGAEGNMRKIFELNRKFHDELRVTGYISRISEVFASKDPSYAAESMMRAIIVNFIRLTSDLWSAISENITDEKRNEIIMETKLFFELLREALELEPIVPLAGSTSNFEQEFCPISGGSSSAIKPKYISPTIMYEFCSVSIMLIAKSRSKKLPSNANETSFSQESNLSVDKYIVDLINTLALNLLHYSTSKCQKMIISKLQELRVTRQDFIIGGLKSVNRQNTFSPIKNSSEGNLNKDIGESSFLPLPIGHHQRSIDNLMTPLSPDVNSNRRLRQKKAATRYLDGGRANPIKPSPISPAVGVIGTKPNKLSDRLAPPMNEDSDMSELEETALSTIDALDISSEMSSEPGNDLINLDSSSGDDNDDVFRSKPIAKPPRVLRPTRSQNYQDERIYTATNHLGSTSSLPMPDLLTGDPADQRKQMYQSFMSNKVSSQSPSPVNSELAINKHQTENRANELEAALSYVYKQTYLPTIKIFCDWLLANGSIITANVQSFRSFDLDMREIVTLLKELDKIVKTKSLNRIDSDLSLSNNSMACGGGGYAVLSTGSGNIKTSTSLDTATTITSASRTILDHVYNGPQWVQKYPLSCDFPLLCLEPLKSVHELNIDFKYRHELNDAELGFLTIQCITAFSHALNAFLETIN